MNRSYSFQTLLLLCVAVSLALGDNTGPLFLNKVSTETGARCIDGTAPGYYFRPGVNDHKNSFILFFEGGGWCYPQAPGECLSRAKTGLGSSLNYTAKIASTGYEGGGGFISGNSNLTAFSDFAVAYFKYCDGGSFTGTREDPVRASDGTLLYYRGQRNVDAMVADLQQNHGLDQAKEVIISGCSAGGMACYIHCDKMAEALHPIPVKCVCDAGAFLDVNNVNGTPAMTWRYTILADQMNSTGTLLEACRSGMADPRLCMFSENSLAYTKTPLFAINSVINFFSMEKLRPYFNASVAYPPDWIACDRTTGGMQWENCNATQREIINEFRTHFLQVMGTATDPKTPHGAFFDTCPAQHCQTTTGWNKVIIESGGKRTTMAEAVARWYFQGTTEKWVDQAMPANPTC